jgi:hypothetical protein
LRVVRVGVPHNDWQHALTPFIIQATDPGLTSGSADTPRYGPHRHSWALNRTHDAAPPQAAPLAWSIGKIIFGFVRRLVPGSVNALMMGQEAAMRLPAATFPESPTIED